MVVSPPYPCQFVLVTKLTAVLKEESGLTAPRPAGLRGKEDWNRWRAYSTARPAVLKTIRETA